MKKHIPNTLTLINLFFGCCAVFSIFQGRFIVAFWFFFASLIADYFDGFLARLLKVQSPLGKELDSLADVISFGVMPGAVYYVLLAYGQHQLTVPAQLDIFALPAFLIPMFAALRLAKFNLDTRQSEYFIGLPTPSVAIFSIGLLLIYEYDQFHLRPLILNPWLLYACIGSLSYLMNAEIPMFNLKFKTFTWEGNTIRYIFIAVSIGGLALLRSAALSFIILLYVGISIAQLFSNKRL